MMVPSLALAAGMLIVAGLIALVAGWRPQERAVAPQPPRSLFHLWARLTRRPPGRTGRLRDLRLLFVSTGGLVVAVISGWYALAPLAPLLLLGLPALLRQPRQHDVLLMEALDRWVRSLAATMGTGRSITDAVRLSRHTAPPVLLEEIGLLVTRLNNRWDTGDALRHFADDVNSADADAVVAALLLASRRGSYGAAATLHALADSLQEQLKARRVIEAERAKPYVVVRQVTLVMGLALGAVLLVNSSFFAPYASPLGQFVLSLLVTAYLGSLVLLRRRARQPARPRLLVRSSA